MSKLKRNAFLSALLLALIAPAVQGGVLTYDQVEAATGQPLEYWGAQWWQRYATGTIENDDGPVFFSNGSGQGLVSLDYTVAASRFILLPVATYVQTLEDPCADLACAEEEVNAVLATIRHEYATIDGVAVPSLAPYFVAADSPHNFTFDVDGALFGPPYEDDVFEALQGGYWLMLEPLSPGRHTITFGGEFEAFPSQFDTIMQLTSVPEPGVTALMSLGLLALVLTHSRRQRAQAARAASAAST